MISGGNPSVLHRKMRLRCNVTFPVFCFRARISDENRIGFLFLKERSGLFPRKEGAYEIFYGKPPPISNLTLFPLIESAVKRLKSVAIEPIEIPIKR